MDTWLIIVIVVLALFVLLAIGGAIAQRRRLVRGTPAFEERLERVSSDLAAAHAQDRGWERSALESAAREAYAEQRSGAEPEAMTLVAIIDRPGTDEDKAVFHVESGGARHDLTLGRRDGQWVFEKLD